MTQLTFDSFIREEDKSAPHSNPVVNSAATNQYALVLISVIAVRIPSLKPIS